MKRFLILAVVVFLGAGSKLFADDYIAPAWRGDEGSTMQVWEFSEFDFTPAPDIVRNPYGDPLLWADSHGWIPTMDCRQGIWPLSGEIDVYIPNRPEILPEKRIWLQLVWKPGDQYNPYLPDAPMVGVVPFDKMVVTRTDTPADCGWTYSIFAIDIWPNPVEEWITIKGDILVDQLVIDTICIPEPGTIGLLSLGGLTLLGRRRRR